MSTFQENIDNNTVKNPTTPSDVVRKQLIFAGSNFMKRFDFNNDISTSQTEITAPLFGSTSVAGSPFFTQSGTSLSATGSAMYMYNNSSTSQLRVYDISYGVFSGSLAANRFQYAAYAGLRTSLLNNLTGSNGQYLLCDGAVGTSGSHKVVAISFQRSDYKQQLDTNGWQINIRSGSSTASYIDNSSIVTGTITRAGLRSDIVSGTLTNGVYSNAVKYGHVYHDLGLVIFDAHYVGGPFSSITVNDSAISASMAKIDQIQGRSSIKLNSTNYFCRAYNKEFNYSTNPTFINTSTGKIQISDYLINGPHTYCTTVGMYNEKNELMAICKLSQPLEKSFSSEFVIRVRLDY